VLSKEIFNVLYSTNIREVGSWNLAGLKDRAVSLKLDQSIIKESLLSLCMRGCISSTIYPTLAGKITLCFGFGYAVCPKKYC